MTGMSQLIQPTFLRSAIALWMVSWLLSPKKKKNLYLLLQWITKYSGFRTCTFIYFKFTSLCLFKKNFFFFLERWKCTLEMYSHGGHMVCFFFLSAMHFIRRQLCQLRQLFSRLYFVGLERLRYPQPLATNSVPPTTWRLRTMTGKFMSFYSTNYGRGVATWQRLQLRSCWRIWVTLSWGALWPNVPSPTSPSSGPAGQWRRRSKPKSSTTWQVKTKPKPFLPFLFSLPELAR